MFDIISYVMGMSGSGGGNCPEPPELDSPATASDILLGKQAIDRNGNIINGTYVPTPPLLPQLHVTTKAGSSVTCTDGTRTLTATFTDSTHTFILPEFGSWTITGEYSGHIVSKTITVDEVKVYTINISYINPILNENSWEDIRRVADESTGSNYWAVGDAKEITLSGKVGYINLTGSKYWVYILGFNHNSELEGENRIHFGFGRTSQSYSDTNGIALIDGSYTNQTNGTTNYIINTSASNSGGWSSSNVRANVLGSSYNPMSPKADTFLSSLPQDLRSVMLVCSKYTDNVAGGTGYQSNINSTQDYVWLLSEFEIFGVRNKANYWESDKQKTYQYYINGNNKAKYQSSLPSSTCRWWTRSASTINNLNFCYVTINGTSDDNYTNLSYGIAPAFCV